MPPPPAPDFTISVTDPITVSAGSQASNQVVIAALNGFVGSVAVGATTTIPGVTPGVVPSSITGSGSATVTLQVPANTSPGTYSVAVSASSGGLSHPRSFNVIVTAAAVTPQSAVFGPTQYLAGTAPASLDALTNWRYEMRLHLSAATLPNGASFIVGLGGGWLASWNGGGPSGLSYSLIFRDGLNGVAEVYVGSSTDIFVRAQRNGATLSLKVWNIDAAGTLTALPEVSGNWTAGATLSPGFLLGAAPDQIYQYYGTRFPFSGQMAFFRFFGANADNATTPNLCDSASSLIRYEFENNLTNSGTASATLAPTNALTYQPTPGASCASGGASAFTLVSGAQSPASVTPGQSATYPVSINRQNFTGTVTFTGCTGPTGVTCTASATTGNSATVSVTTTAGTPATTHQLNLTASGSGVPNAATNLPLVVVTAGGGGSSSISLSTPSTPAAVSAGSSISTSTSTSVSITSNGFTGPVNLGCSAPNLIVSCTATVNVVNGPNAAFTLPIVVAAGATAGNYLLSIAASGLNVAAPPVTTNLAVVACGLTNLDTTQLPLNGGATIRLQMGCTPPSGTTSINWELLNSSGQVVSAIVNTTSIYTYTAPANAGNSAVSYTARATYVGSTVYMATFPIAVNPPIGLSISPQSSPPYLINPGGQFLIGVQVVGTANTLHLCTANYGTLTKTSLPNFTQGWIYWPPVITGSQLSVVISCVSSANSIARDSFPLLVDASVNIPPTVTSVTWIGNGNTTSFQPVTVQGTHALPGVPPQAVSLLISPSIDGFAQTNACWADAYGIAYGASPTASWRLWNNAGSAISYDQGQLSYYQYPAVYNIYYKYNSQCQANYVTIPNTFSNNYGPAAITYTGGNTISVTHGMRYLPPFVGTHAVWGQITIYSGLQSAWTAPLVAPFKLIVQ